MSLIAIRRQLLAEHVLAPSGLVGVKTTGIESSPLTRFAGRNGSASSVASRRSGVDEFAPPTSESSMSIICGIGGT